MAKNDMSLSDDFNENPLEGYYFIRVYNKGVSPYSTVSDLDEDTARQICSEIAPGRVGGDDYMQKRREIDAWLREGAGGNGVSLGRENPVYFGITKDPEPFVESVESGKKHETFGSDVELDIEVLPAADLDLSNWSFTMNDHFFADMDDGQPDKASFGESDIPSHHLHGKVLNARELADFIKNEGYENEGPHILEAQLWAHGPTWLEGRGPVKELAGVGLGSNVSTGLKS